MLKTNDYSFTRFLKNEKFIEWKLFPTEELIIYWQNFLQEHPEEKENFMLAEKHFLNIQFSSYQATTEKKTDTLRKLENSLTTFRRRRKIQMATYVAAVCTALLILSLLYIQTIREPSSQNGVQSTEYIVGNQLDSKDIKLIANNSTSSFQENINIEIEEDGTAQVKAGNDDEKEIYIAQNTMNKLIVPYGKQSQIMLSDGTRMWLNSGSILEFPAQFYGENREVRLTSGEIYIEVAHDKKKPFRVLTSKFNVRVYGTKFNVSNYADSPQSIVLVEGSVSLQVSGEKELFLLPNQQAIYAEDGSFSTQKVNADQFISWKNGYLEFDNTPMPRVLKQIERYYNLSFNYDKNVSLNGLTCTGKIILSDNLDNVMTTIALISSTKYERKNSTIYITK